MGEDKVVKKPFLRVMHKRPGQVTEFIFFGPYTALDSPWLQNDKKSLAWLSPGTGDFEIGTVMVDMEKLEAMDNSPNISVFEPLDIKRVSVKLSLPEIFVRD